MIHWYWAPIFLFIGVVVAFIISRYFDAKLDAIQEKLESLIKK